MLNIILCFIHLVTIPKNCNYDSPNYQTIHSTLCAFTPKNFYGETVAIANYLQNRSPTQVFNNKTSYELSKSTLNLSNLCVFR